MFFYELLQNNQYLKFLFDFLINIITVTVLCYNIYYKRYHDKEAVTSYMLFNVFVFIVITILFSSSESMSIGFGFGLFAILSIVTLRSDALSKREITYFFGVLSIALINAINITDYTFIILCNIIIVAGAWAIDHPKILQGVKNINIILDYIPE